MNIQWTNEKRKVKDLLPADYNPRIISEKEREDLEYSLETYGYVTPVAINIGTRENILIGGHRRVETLAKLGRLEEEVDVRVPERELTNEEERGLNLVLNKVGGQFDFDKLSKNYDIETLLRSGFDGDELSRLFDNVDVIDDIERGSKSSEPKEPVVPRMQIGDVFECGNHRVMLGDSTNIEHVEKLMDGEKAEMIYCDPPYNIGLDYTKGTSNGPDSQEKKSFRDGEATYSNDKKSDLEYASFLLQTITNALKVSKKDIHVFYWCDEKYIGLVQELYNKSGVSNKRVCMWIKNNFNLTPQIAFNKVYEPCVYGTIGTPFLDKRFTKLNEILNNNVDTGNQVHSEILDIFNIWLVKREDVSEYEHPTQKPLDLHQKPLRRCTTATQVVLDLFGGSGSTMMACEQLGRFARTMEIDPVFCENILRRWEKFTGLTAKKI